MKNSYILAFAASLFFTHQISAEPTFSKEFFSNAFSKLSALFPSKNPIQKAKIVNAIGATASGLATVGSFLVTIKTMGPFSDSLSDIVPDLQNGIDTKKLYFLPLFTGLLAAGYIYNYCTLEKTEKNIEPAKLHPA